ncbi:MAG TPA: DUF5666 domain-containing protein [Patescibacteria group bacterium]
MNNKIIIALSLLLLATSFTPVKAQEAASDSGTTESLKKRIEKLVEEKRDQIEGVLTELGAKKRAFIGEVTRVSEESLTVKTRKGTEIVSTENVELRKSNREVAVKDIAVGDWVVVMGYIQDDTFQAKRILASATTLRPDPQLVEIGTITAFDRTSFTFRTRGTEEIITVSTSTTTEYQDIQGEEIDRSDITEETQALIVGTDDGGEKEATVIRVLTTVDNAATDN